MTRVYLPATVDDLRELATTGALGSGLEGYAATSAIRADLSGYSDEEVEFALSTAAADASALRQLEAGLTDARRVVMVVDVADRRVSTRDDAAGIVGVSEPVEQVTVEAVLADIAPVRLPADGETLGWYAVQELSGLLR
jgi:hypothetical protein